MLTECDECGKQVSDKANSCPHCGVPLREADNQVLSYLETRAKYGIRISTIATIVGAALFLPAVIIRSQSLLAIAALLGVPGILGLLVHNVRLSHLAETRYSGRGRQSKQGRS
jgi:hypothetical protein